MSQFLMDKNITGELKAGGTATQPTTAPAIHKLYVQHHPFLHLGLSLSIIGKISINAMYIFNMQRQTETKG